MTPMSSDRPGIRAAFHRDYGHFGFHLLAHVFITFTLVVALYGNAKLTYLIGSWAALVGAVAAWTFVLTYLREPWLNTEAGRHLMAFTGGLAVILTWVVARNFLDVEPHVDVLTRMVIFIFVAAHLVWRVRILHRQVRLGRVVTEAVTHLKARSE